MIISYLTDIGLTELVFQNYGTNLPDLIRLCFSAKRLQVQDLFDIRSGEYEMISADALRISQPLKEIA
jgi:hypothetical protein